MRVGERRRPRADRDRRRGLRRHRAGDRLREAGIDDFTILERADALGGTWRDNTYPGLRLRRGLEPLLVLVRAEPATGRARSAARRRSSTTCARVADEHDVERDVRYGSELHRRALGRRRDALVARHVAGPLTAGVLVPATGPFGDPVMPDMPGLDTFEGKVPLASAGTTSTTCAASASRSSAPARRRCSSSRDPAAGRPAAACSSARRRGSCRASTGRRASPSARCCAACPGCSARSAACIYVLIEGLGSVIFVDQRFRHGPTRRSAAGSCAARCPTRSCGAKLTPDYTIGCKRAIRQRRLPAGADAAERGRGHRRRRRGPRAVGRDRRRQRARGRHDHLRHRLRRARARGASVSSAATAAAWPRSTTSARRATSAPRWPGSRTSSCSSGRSRAAGNQSALYMLEAQMAYIVDALRAMRAARRAAVEVRAEAQEAFVAEAERAQRDTVWLTGGCRSYYTTPDGRNAGLWPELELRVPAAHAPVRRRRVRAGAGVTRQRIRTLLVAVERLPAASVAVTDTLTLRPRRSDDRSLLDTFSRSRRVPVPRFAFLVPRVRSPAFARVALRTLASSDASMMGTRERRAVPSPPGPVAQLVRAADS